MNRRSILKLLAVTPFGGFASLGCTADRKKPVDHTLYSVAPNACKQSERNYGIRYIQYEWQNEAINIDSRSDSIHEFHNCKFTNCNFRRFYKTSIVRFHHCYFENCDEIHLTNLKDEFYNNVYRDTSLIVPSIPNAIINSRRARGEIA